MHPITPLSLVLAFLLSLTSALEANRQLQVSAWPLSDASPHSLANVDYNSTHATVRKWSAPKLSEEDEGRIVRVGFSNPVTNAWSGVATSAANFGPGKEKTVLLHLDSEGKAFHVGFRAMDSSSAGPDKQTLEELKAEVVPMTPGPMVHLNKPVVLNAEGQLDGKEPEKSFLQK